MDYPLIFKLQYFSGYMFSWIKELKKPIEVSVDTKNIFILGSNDGDELGYVFNE